MNSWISIYIEPRKKYFYSEEHKKNIQHLIAENQGNSYLYSLVKPTGIIYGCVQQMPFEEVISNQLLSENREYSIILLECFIHCSIFHEQQQNESAEPDLSKIFKQIEAFYSIIAPDLTQSCRKLCNDKTDQYELVSYIIDKNIDIDNLFVENNFTRYFFNSLLFLDLIYFDRFIANPNEKLFDQYEATLATLLKVFTSASHANENKLSRGEKVLFESLIRTFKLSENKEKEIIKFIKNPIVFENIDFSAINSYSLKKLCFEMAFLMIMTDNIVTESEQLYLEKIVFQLQLSSQEKRNSIESVQNFIVKAWNNRVLYNDNINYQNLHKGVLKKITALINRNKAKIMKEVYESKELVELLSKSTKQELSKEEKEKVKAQLSDILKTIPSLAIFMLPGGALLLTILMKILPGQMLLPSSFQDKKEN